MRGVREVKRRISSLTIKEKLRFDYLMAKTQWETVKLVGILTALALIMTAVLVWTLMFTSSYRGIFIWILGILIASAWGAWRLLRIDQRAAEESKVIKETGQ